MKFDLNMLTLDRLKQKYRNNYIQIHLNHLTRNII